MTVKMQSSDAFFAPRSTPPAGRIVGGGSLVLATHGSALGYGLPGTGRGTSPGPPGNYTRRARRAGHGQNIVEDASRPAAQDPQRDESRGASSCEEEPFRHDKGPPRSSERATRPLKTGLVRRYQKYRTKSAKPATILFHSCHAYSAGLLVLPAPAPLHRLPVATAGTGILGRIDRQIGLTFPVLHAAKPPTIEFGSRPAPSPLRYFRSL